jgi:serine/threonine protein kinase
VSRGEHPSLSGLTEPIDGEPSTIRGKAIDRYIVVDEVGAGGMGVVYKAYDPDLGRLVALKLVGRARNVRAGARLEREARAIAKLAHPNVVAVYDVGRVDEQLFIAMEFVVGASLTDWLAGVRRSQRDVIDVFTQSARGLAAAHDAGLVHRDFKPDNVLIGSDGRARVADFGLAYLDDVDDSGSGVAAPPIELPPESVASSIGLKPDLTPPGAPVGTPRYMSPEQHRGQRVDPRADQFAWSIAFYEALTRQRAFPGADVTELRRAVLNNELRDFPPGAGVPKWLQQLLRRALAIDPGKRWPSMHDIVDELDRDRAGDRMSTLDGSANTDPMIAAFPPPEGAAARVEHLRARLDQAWAKKSRGAWTAATSLCRDVLDASREIDYPPLTAAALYLRGNLEHRTGAPGTARDTLYQAAHVAARAGDDWQLANTWVFLVLVVGAGLGNVDESEALARVAEIAIARVGDNASLRSRLHTYRGASLGAGSRFRDAAHELERAVAVDRFTHGPTHAFTAVSLLNLAEAWLDAGEAERAREPLTTAAAIVQPTSPPPTTARVRARALTARLALADGDIERARIDLEVAIDVWSRQPGRTRSLADALVDLATCQRKQGELVEAELTAQRAVDLAAHAADFRVRTRAEREFALVSAAAAGR